MYQCFLNSGFKFKNLLITQKVQKGGNGDLQAQYANDCEMIIYLNKGRKKFNKTELVKTDGRKGANQYRTRLPNVWFDTEYNKFPKSTVNVSNQKSKIIHPTEKNVEIVEWYLKIHTDENDTVFDPFTGSGTTGVACKNLNHNFIGIELDENYYNISINRIKEMKDEKIPIRSQ